MQFSFIYHSCKLTCNQKKKIRKQKKSEKILYLISSVENGIRNFFSWFFRTNCKDGKKYVPVAKKMHFFGWLQPLGFSYILCTLRVLGKGFLPKISWVELLYILRNDALSYLLALTLGHLHRNTIHRGLV